MKNRIKILAIILIVFSSCTENAIDDCNCIKSVSEETVGVGFKANGLPYTYTVFNKLHEEQVQCTDEVYNVRIGDNIVYSIICEK